MHLEVFFMSLATTDSTPVYENWKSATRVEGSTNMIIYLNYLFDHDLLVIILLYLWYLMVIRSVILSILITPVKSSAFRGYEQYRWHLTASSHVGWWPGTVIPRIESSAVNAQPTKPAETTCSILSVGLLGVCGLRNQNEESFRPKKQEIRMQLLDYFLYQHPENI